MRKDLSHITLVVDRSGSMEAIKDDAEGGINAFLSGQRSGAGEATTTLVQFDSVIEIVHRNTPLDEVGRYDLVPRGSTALLDAMALAIKKTHKDLKKLPKSERPGLVTVVVMTDGMENASQYYTRDRLKKLIKKRKKKNGWTFLFLAANQDAFAEAQTIGIDRDHAASYAAQHYRSTCSTVDDKLRRMRRQTLRGEPVASAFTPEERESME